MIEYDPSEQGQEVGGLELRVKVIGVGGSGANVLDRMALEGSDEAELLTLNTDMRALSTSVSSGKIQLGATLLKGMGAGGDPELGKQAALEAVDEIREAVRSSDMVFLCVGLGGGTGSGAAPEVCRIAKEEGVFLVVFATLPFSFEGQRRMTQALDALNQIGRYANAVMTFENDRMGELIVPKDGVAQAFAAADKIISQSIRATINVVQRPGIIRIGMDDLLTALEQKHSRCLFGYGLAKGEGRSLEAVEQALNCPLLDRGKLLNEASSVMVQVAGGDSMTLHEVQLVMQEVSKHVGADTQILFGTGTDQRLGNSLGVTIISSLAGPEIEGSSVEEDKAVDPLEAAAHSTMPTTSPLAAAVSAAAVTAPAAASPPRAAAASADIGAKAAVYEPLETEASPPAPKAAPAPVAPEPAPESEPEPVAAPALVVEDPVPAEPKSEPIFIEEEDPAAYNNPIAAAVQGAAGGSAPVAAVSHAEEPSAEVVEEPAPQIPETPPAVEERPEPVPAAAPAVPAATVEESPSSLSAPDQEEVTVSSVENPADKVEATTDSEETITLSRIVSEGKTGKIKTRAPMDNLPGPVEPSLPPSVKMATSPTTAEAQQQQEMLQLDPVEPAAKGRFAKSDPTIVDGEDLDVPTFLRKKS